MPDQSMGASPTADEIERGLRAAAALKDRIAALDAAVLRSEKAEQEEPAALEPPAGAPEGDTGAGRLPKKKSCIFLAYNGHGFSGMQMNPGVPTIELALRDALVAAGGISQDNADKLNSLKWARSARTDKGVSALGQVVSLKLLHPPDLVANLQRRLPDKIKIFGIRKVTQGFDARLNCDSRLYEYSLPEWVFDPDLFPGKPSWRPPGYPTDAAVIPPDSSGAGAAAQAVSGLADTPLLLREGYSATAPPTGSKFVFDDECLARMNSILKGYEGCHNFHNFSPNVTPDQMSAQRLILKFECTGVFTIGKGSNEARWVRTRVHGQSFLLNQIRKMVGLAIAVYRGTASDDAIHRALDPCLDLSTPMAPELGLFLAECRFDIYNEKYGFEREPLNLGDWADEVEAFKLEKIYPALVKRDRAEAVNYRWLQSVTDARFMFSTWATAQPVRKLKRPRARLTEDAENQGGPAAKQRAK